MSLAGSALAVAAVLLAVLSLLVFLPTKVKASVRGGGGSLVSDILIKPSVLPCYIRLPKIPNLGLREKSGVPLREKDCERQPGEQGGPVPALPRVLSGAAEISRLYPAARDGLASLIKEIRFTRLRIRARAGTGDACETAMLCGTLNAVCGLLLSCAARHGVSFTERPCARFSPVFDSPCFDLALETEVSFSVFGVMKAVWRFTKAKSRLNRRGPASKSALFQKSVEY